MHDVLILLVKGVIGGSLVVGFALLSETLRPKSFAGLFGAAPSIALAALVVTVVTKGAHAGREQSFAMVFGAVAFVAYCLTATIAVDKWGALRGSATAFATWFAVALSLYVGVLAR